MRRKGNGVSVSTKTFSNGFYKGYAKRWLDFLLAIVALVFASPILIVVFLVLPILVEHLLGEVLQPAYKRDGVACLVAVVLKGLQVLRRIVGQLVSGNLRVGLRLEF